MKQCLIVVDYQVDFVSGTLGFPAARLLEPRIAARIREYRGRGDDVLFTLDTHGEDYETTQEGRLLPLPHCIRNTLGHDLYGEINALKSDGDPCFFKNTFGSDTLYGYLKKTPYESIELCGVVTDICVLSNAVLAKTAQPETPIFIDAQCVASNDVEKHNAALAVLRSLQIKILFD